MHLSLSHFKMTLRCRLNLWGFTETRLKIILGAEVANAVGCKEEDVDKKFVLGMLLQASNINAKAKARIEL